MLNFSDRSLRIISTVLQRSLICAYTRRGGGGGGGGNPATAQEYTRLIRVRESDRKENEQVVYTYILLEILLLIVLVCILSILTFFLMFLQYEDWRNYNNMDRVIEEATREIKDDEIPGVVKKVEWYVVW